MQILCFGHEDIEYRYIDSTLSAFNFVSAAVKSFLGNSTIFIFYFLVSLIRETIVKQAAGPIEKNIFFAESGRGRVKQTHPGTLFRSIDNLISSRFVFGT